MADWVNIDAAEIANSEARAWARTHGFDAEPTQFLQRMTDDYRWLPEDSRLDLPSLTVAETTIATRDGDAYRECARVRVFVDRQGGKVRIEFKTRLEVLSP